MLEAVLAVVCILEAIVILAFARQVFRGDVVRYLRPGKRYMLVLTYGGAGNEWELVEIDVPTHAGVKARDGRYILKTEAAFIDKSEGEKRPLTQDDYTVFTNPVLGDLYVVESLRPLRREKNYYVIAPIQPAIKNAIRKMGRPVLQELLDMVSKKEEEVYKMKLDVIRWAVKHASYVNQIAKNAIEAVARAKTEEERAKIVQQAIGQMNKSLANIIAITDKTRTTIRLLNATPDALRNLARILLPPDKQAEIDKMTPEELKELLKKHGFLAD